MNNIPQFEPSFGTEEADAVNAYMRSGGWLTENKKTIEFELRLAEALEVPHVSCVNNGTISLVLALKASGVQPGDKVIVPDITMIATPNAAWLLGAEPLLVDLDPANLCLNLATTKRLVQNDARIKAVFYVSLNGRSHSAAELNDFKTFCHNHGVTFIEDAAQSFASKTADGAFVGTIGDYGSFSFSPHKIISTGQGGALVTNEQLRYEDIERLKDFGRLAGGADVHDHFGINSKFTDMQAVVGIEQLKKLQTKAEQKKHIYCQYAQQLADVKEVQFLSTNLSHTIPWFVDVYAERRNELSSFLKGRGIQTRFLYPAIHTQAIYPDKGDPNYNHNDLVVSTEMAPKGLWFPSSLKLTTEEIKTVCDSVKDFYAGKV